MSCLCWWTDVRKEAKELRDGTWQVVVGTPVRIHDLINRKALKLNDLKLFCLDEAEHILPGQSEGQIHTCEHPCHSQIITGADIFWMEPVFELLPKHTQVVLLSTTTLNDKFEVTTKFMRNPVKVLVKQEDFTFDGVTQFYIAVKGHKIRSLCKLWKTVTTTKAIIFCNSRVQVDQLAKEMTSHGFTVSALVRTLDPVLWLISA